MGNAQITENCGIIVGIPKDTSVFRKTLPLENKPMLFVVQSGNGDVIERMWRLMVSARRNDDTPEIWRLTDDILESVREFYRLGQSRKSSDSAAGDASINRFLDIPVDPTTTMPHLLCHPDVVYHL